MVQTAAKPTLNFTIRPASLADLNFITDTWMRSFRRSITMRDMNSQEYFVRQRPVMESLLARSTVFVGEEPRSGELVSYIVFERKQSGCVVHWLYTKLVFRNLGIGASMLEAAAKGDSPIYYTHKPTAIYGVKLAKKYSAQYNPKFL